MKLLMTVLFLILGLSTTAFAGGHGDSSGNGGTVMACKSGTAQETLVTYDIYEGQAQRHLSPQMGVASLDYAQKVDMVLNRIPDQNSEFREELKSYWQEFKSQSEFGDFNLVPVDDTGELVIAPGCEIRQAAVQREPSSSVEKRYFLDQKIWNRLDSDSKAALVLHEITYRMLIVRGHITSVGARLLNSYLMDGREVTTAPCLYLSILNDLQAPADLFAKIGDLTVLAGKSSITPSCQLKSAVAVDGFITVRGQKLTPSSAGEVSVNYDDQGHVEHVVINQEQSFKIGSQIYRLGLNDKGLGEIFFDGQENPTQATVNNIDVVLQGHHLVLAKGILYFAADGSVTGVSAMPAGFQLSIDGLELQGVQRIDLYDGGVRLWVPHDVTLSTPQGKVTLAGLFFFSGKNELVEAMTSAEASLKVGEQNCTAAKTNVHFYPGHSVSRFIAGQSCQLSMASGEVRNVIAGNLVSLDKQGRVIDIH